MQRIAGPGAIDGLFVEEDTGTGQPPTQITAAWMNSVQEEICSVIAAATIELSSGSNGQLLTAIAALISAAGSGGRQVPIGGIIEWSGAISAIPEHWALCNGGNGTPDLRARFIMGADSTGSYTVGTTGGSADAVVPLHSHNASSEPHSHSTNAINGDPGSDAFSTGGGAFHPTHVDTTASATVTVTIADAGEIVTGKNIPPFYALAYIMLIS